MPTKRRVDATCSPQTGRIVIGGQAPTVSAGASLEPQGGRLGIAAVTERAKHAFLTPGTIAPVGRPRKRSEPSWMVVGRYIDERNGTTEAHEAARHEFTKPDGAPLELSTVVRHYDKYLAWQRRGGNSK